jgi:hypothetical protein
MGGGGGGGDGGCLCEILTFPGAAAITATSAVTASADNNVAHAFSLHIRHTKAKKSNIPAIINHVVSTLFVFLMRTAVIYY